MSLADGSTAHWKGLARTATSHRSRTDAMDWALSAAPILVVFAELTLLGVNSGVLAAGAALTNVLLLAVLAGLMVRRTSVFAALTPVLILVMCAAAWGLAMGRFSIVPSEAPLEAAKLLGLLSLLVCGVLAGARRARSRLFCGVLAAAGGVYAVGSFWLYEADPFRVMGVVKVTHTWRFTGTLLNANVAGVVFGMICLTALGWVQSLLGRNRLIESRPVLVAAGLGAALISLVACGFTGSRMAFAWTVVLGAVLCLVVIFKPRAAEASHGVPRTAALVAVAASILLAAGLGVSKVLIREDSAADTFIGRLDALHRFIDLALQRPFAGWGLGAFDQVNQSTLTTASAADMYDFGAVHSSLVQAFLEGGAPYLFLLCTAGLMVVLQVAANWRHIVDGWSRGLAAAVTLAAVCSLDDIDLNVPAVAGLATLMLGVLWGRAIVVQGRALQEAPR